MATVDALLAVASGAWPTAREIRRAFGDVAVERRAYRCPRGKPCVDVARGAVLHVSRRHGVLVVYAASAEAADGAAREALGPRVRVIGGDRVPLASVARAPEPRHFLTMLVLGLGCTSLSEKDAERMRVRMERRLGMPARVFCDRLSRTLLTIGKTACAMRPSGSSAMVKEVAGWAEHYTKVGFDVVLVGHSYGGSVVAACAEGMKRRNPRLHMVTLGSIYVPGPSRTPYADIRHVVNVGDIAMKCNGLDPGRDGAFVEFRETDAGARPSLRKRWALHRAYSVDDAVRGVVGALT